MRPYLKCSAAGAIYDIDMKWHSLVILHFLDLAHNCLSLTDPQREEL